MIRNEINYCPNCKITRNGIDYCPNCESIAQFKTSTPMYFENGVWKQQKRCDHCGCVVILRYAVSVEKINYPECEVSL